MFRGATFALKGQLNKAIVLDPDYAWAFYNKVQACDDGFFSCIYDDFFKEGQYDKACLDAKRAYDLGVDKLYNFLKEEELCDF